MMLKGLAGIVNGSKFQYVDRKRCFLFLQNKGTTNQTNYLQKLKKISVCKNREIKSSPNAPTQATGSEKELKWVGMVSTVHSHGKGYDGQRAQAPPQQVLLSEVLWLLGTGYAHTNGIHVCNHLNCLLGLLKS